MSYDKISPHAQDFVGERSPDGKRHGFGRAILPNRDQYEGDYRNGLRHGRGCYIFKKNGARYEGEWKKGLKHGHGKFHYPDGSVYCGEWKENKKHGSGKYTYDNGDVYEGEFYIKGMVK
jgi:radial spoke head protein 1